MGYYVIHADGSKYGPAELLLLQKWVGENRISETTLLEDEVTGISTPASLVPGLNFAVKPPSTADLPPVQQAPTAAPTNPYESGPYAGSPYGAPSFSEAPRQVRQEKVDNHLVKAIFATLCCCIIGGVISIINAAQVDGCVRRGDMAGAYEHSERADNWANWSIGIGLVFGIIRLIVLFANGGPSH
jgi:hypothetical protein